MNLIKINVPKFWFQFNDTSASNTLKTANVTLWSDDECLKALADNGIDYVAGSSLCASEKVSQQFWINSFTV